ncbi:MAG TPA: FecR domain-containing protein, partial [Fodinibius sp.]|nr:FecR domain-containing protein [Fodinibius sp.]
MRRDVIEKFINNTCTEEEAERALDWFSTPEGQRYLEEKIRKDLSLLQYKRIRKRVSATTSEQMWKGISRRIGYGTMSRSDTRKKNPLYWGAVAAVCILLTSSMFYLWSYSSVPQEAPEPIYHSTGEEQQKVIRLNDGSEIRLNSNTELWISATFGEPNRRVTLNGEAYFKVIHDEEKPFLIDTPNASVKDLGTAFNVRAFPGDDNVQVAVTEGKVTLWSDRQTEEEATELIPGQFGFLDLRNHSVEVDEFENGNYLSWMNGRMEFDDMPLEKVCKQLSR